MSTQIRVLTLNCWGLKYVSRHRTARIAAIASVLSRTDRDIVALQELWVYSDYEIVKDAVSKILPYSKFFYSGALGAGLVIFTRFPILASSILPYSLNGAPTDVLAGDWFVGKAAASVVIEHPVLGQIQVYNTHLFAKGGEGGPEHHRAHRLVNAWEFAKLAKTSAELGRHVIALGDFNSVPSSLPMEIMREHAGLTDAWATFHASSLAPSTSATPQDALVHHGITADSPINSYSSTKPLEPYAVAHAGKRLDYVMYRPPARLPPEEPRMTCTAVRVTFTERVPGRGHSHSDHFGVEATLSIVRSDPTPNEETAKGSGLSPEAVTTTLQALTAAYRISAHRSRRELSVFVMSVFVALGLVVVSPFLRSGWSSFATLSAVAAGWLGTTMLYEGFLYGNWERNALRNGIEELEIFRRGLAAGVDATTRQGVIERDEAGDRLPGVGW